MSIRLRLSLFYSAILALTLLVFGLLLYFVQAEYTYSTIKRDLTGNADRILQSINRALMRQPVSSHPEFIPIPVELLGEQTFKDIRTRDVIRVLGADGSLAVSPFTRDTEALPLTAGGLALVQDGNIVWEICTIEGEKLLVNNTPLMVNDQVVLIIQSARALTDRDRSLESLSHYLIIAGLFTTLAAFGAGWLLAKVSLSPIQRITQTAQEIGSERDFSRRVAHRGPNDEVGQLATTFNAMLNQLQDAYQKVAQALNMQREFVADVSHELRTPLTTVRGNLALLLRKPPIPAREHEEIVTDMVDESERLIRLVNDLLTLARADAGRTFTSERVNLHELVEEVADQAHRLDPERVINITCPPEAAARGDRDAVKQILLILVDNALKHSGGVVEVAVGGTDTLVSVAVQDRGPGIAGERLERIFDRFYRADESRSTPGFGLGLPIARALVEGQGGTIGVQSKVGEGSVFTFWLPRYHEQPEG